MILVINNSGFSHHLYIVISMGLLIWRDLNRIIFVIIKVIVIVANLLRYMIKCDYKLLEEIEVRRIYPIIFYIIKLLNITCSPHRRDR